MSARKCAAYMCVCEWGAGVVKQSGLISDWWQLCDWCNVGWEWVCCSAVNDGSCSPWVMCSCSVVRGNQIRDRHSVSHCSRLRKITVQYESHPLILCRDWRMHFHTKKTVHLYIHCDFLIAKNGYIYFQWFSFLIPSSQNNKLIFHRPKNSSINPYIKNSTFCSSLKTIWTILQRPCAIREIISQHIPTEKKCPLFRVSLICMSLLHYATVPEYLSQNQGLNKDERTNFREREKVFP